MSLVLNTNISSMVAQNNLTSSGAQLATSLQQLSSGMRINTAADDAAGYAIVQGMTSQINGIGQAARNANDGVSLSQTASGALQEVVNDLQTMRDIAVQSLNATNSTSDRADLDAQFQQLKADINSVASQTQFNGVNLLDGTFQGATFQVGANAGQSITMSSISSSKASNLGQLYTAAATDPVAYSASGAAPAVGNLAVAANDAGSFTLTAGGKTYSTSSVTLTGNQTTDLKTIAAAINQATGAAGVVATVDTTGKGINLSSTTAGTVGVSYTATTGTATIATFGLKASNALGVAAAGFSAAAATGITAGAYTTALGAGAGSDTVTLHINGAAVAPVTLTGTQATDLAAINAAVQTAVPGVTGNINANGGIDFTSATSQTLTITATFGGTAGGTAAVPPTPNFGSTGGTVTSGAYSTALAASLVANGGDGTDQASFSVTIGANTYTAAPVTLTGTQATDVAAVAAAIQASTGFTAAGFTATANANGGIDFGGATASTTATVAATFADSTGPVAAQGSEDVTTFGFTAGANNVTMGTNTGGAGSALVPGTAVTGTETMASLGLGTGTIAITTAATAVTSTTSTLDTSDVNTVDDSNKVLLQVDAALQQLATIGAQLGAYQNRFQAAVTGLNTNQTNLTSARSQIQDTDYASATSALSKAQILQQASTAMVSQANTIPQNILSLLQKLP